MSRNVGLCVVILFACSASPVAAQQWAAKMFKVTSHDFGTVARGAKAEFEFAFQNIYKEEVHVASVRSSCGCTTPSVTKSTLKTWEKSSIVAKYNTRSFYGARGATITVVFDRPYYAEVQLTVKGYIRSDVVFNPGEVNFGDVDQFAAAERKVRVEYAGRSDWRIEDVRSANDHLEVELTELQRQGGRIRYEMLVRLKPDAPAGYFNDELTLVTDDVRLRTIPLLVSGHVVSPLTVSPASLFMGVLKPGQSASKQIIVRGKQPFSVKEIRCGDDRFQFTRPGEEKKLLHFIPVQFTAGDQAGDVSETIEIVTDLGDGASASCLATATIEAPEPAAQDETREENGDASALAERPR